MRNWVGVWGAVLLPPLLGTCSDPVDEPELGTIEVLESPAAPGSGEPFLSGTADGSVLLSWLEQQADTSVALRFAAWNRTGWSQPRTVIARRDFFVNWADFPSIVELPDGRFAAHWLQREGSGEYAYGVRIAMSSDEGVSWSDPIAPHTDSTPTEHGFVSLFADGEDLGVVWLDGRNMGGGHEDGGDMTIRYARIDANGARHDEAEIDARTCECCQTDVALTESGPVVAYRDRSPAEVRNIVVSRRVNGMWSAPMPIDDDAWTIAACPVNGPAIVAAGRAVAVAWFSAPGDRPKVKVAFSRDAGATFDVPVRVDDGNPAGRVDLIMLEDGSVLVSWIERTTDGAAIRARRVPATGRPGGAADVAASSAERASGFPRMTRVDGGVLFAWTESGSPARVRLARLVLSP